MSSQESAKMNKLFIRINWQNLLYFFVGLGAAGVGELSRLPLKEIGAGGLGLLALVFLFRGAAAPAREKKQDAPAQPDASDTKAEKESIQFTRPLGKNYEVLSNVAGPFGKIDHLVLSKSGKLFVIHGRLRHCKVDLAGGELVEDGKPLKKEVMEGFQHNVDWVSEQVTSVTGAKPSITPLVVYPNARITFTHSVQGVTLINQRYLSDFIQAAQTNSRQEPPVWVKKDALVRLFQPGR